MDFAEKIKNLRINAGLTQQQLAKHLDITASAIGYLENGQRAPTGSTLIAYAKYFSISIDSLVGLEPDLEDGIFTTNINIQTDATSALTNTEEKLLRNFRSLPSDLQHRANAYMEKLVELINEESVSAFPMAQEKSPTVRKKA